jgi:hypothetical protein
MSRYYLVQSVSDTVSYSVGLIDGDIPYLQTLRCNIYTGRWTIPIYSTFVWKYH